MAEFTLKLYKSNISIVGELKSIKEGEKVRRGAQYEAWYSRSTIDAINSVAVQAYRRRLYLDLRYNKDLSE